MRHTNKLMLFSLGLALWGPARADQPFPEGMVSLSFDDGSASQYTLARPALAQHGYHATFYIISDYLTWGGYLTVDQARELAADGHEIGSHSKTHPDLTMLSDADLASELSQSQHDLVTSLSLPDVPDFAVPIGRYDNRTLAATWQYYLSSRTVDAHTNFRETSHYHLGAYGCDTSTTVDGVKALIDGALAERSWLILYLHVLTTGAPAPGTSEFQLSSFDEILDYLALRSAKVVTIREGLALMNAAPPVPPRTPVDAAWLPGWVRMSAPLAAFGRYAQRATEIVGGGAFYIENPSADRASGAWELTAVAHADSRTGLWLRLTPDSPPNVRAGFDLSQGTVLWVEPDGAAATASIDDLGDGWYRCRLSVTSPIIPSIAQVGLLDGSGAISHPADGTSGLYLSEATLAPPAPPPAATHLSVNAPSSATAGTAFGFTVTALDASNNRVAGYSGNVHFTSTDGQAILPVDSTLTNGLGTFSAALGTAGNQTLTATDSLTSSITGTSSIINVTASQYLLTVNLAGTGSGTITVSQQGLTGFACNATSCSGSYAPGTSVTLTAVPDDTSSFSGWSGACSGNGSCTVTMTGPIAVTATLARLTPQYLVTVTRTGSGSGTVSSAPAGIACGSTCSAQYYSGTFVALSAIPAAGSTFGGWSGACSGTKSCRFTVAGDVSIGAAFNPVTYALKVSVLGNGKGWVTVEPPGSRCSAKNCSYDYAVGTSVSLSATPTTGRFTGWSGPCSGTGTCQVTMSSAQSVAATFTR